MTSSERSPSKAFGFIEQTAAPRILYVRPRHGSADAPEHAGDLQLPIGGQHFFPARRALAGEQDVVKIAKHVRLAALSNRRAIHEASIRWDTMRGSITGSWRSWQAPPIIADAPIFLAELGPPDGKRFCANQD